MRIAMAVVYRDRSYYYAFESSHCARISSDKDADLQIPKLKTSFRVYYQAPNICVVTEPTAVKQAVHLDDFFVDGDSRIIIFCTQGTNSCEKVELPRQGEVRFGRKLKDKSGQNHLAIDLPFVSALHGKILRAGSKTVIVDRNSKNGIYVNGKKVKKEQLTDGDVICIYTLRMIYREGCLLLENAKDRVFVSEDQDTEDGGQQVVAKEQSDIDDLLKELAGE